MVCSAAAVLDAIVDRDDVHAWLTAAIAGQAPLPEPPIRPISWRRSDRRSLAAGVTYFRSRTARMENPSRPAAAIFTIASTGPAAGVVLQGQSHRVRGSGETVRIRRDAAGRPQPELTLAVTSWRHRRLHHRQRHELARLEGENLCTSAAKVYDGSCGLGPCLYITPAVLPPTQRSASQFGGQAWSRLPIDVACRMKRTPRELVDYLYRTQLSAGLSVLTGTGVVPPDDFTLAVGDEVAITIGPIGTLVIRSPKADDGLSAPRVARPLGRVPLAPGDAVPAWATRPSRSRCGAHPYRAVDLVPRRITR